MCREDRNWEGYYRRTMSPTSCIERIHSQPFIMMFGNEAKRLREKKEHNGHVRNFTAED